MDDVPARHEAFASSLERFRALVELLGSDLAMQLPLPELEALVEPGFQALLSEMRKEYWDLQARRASESKESGREAGDAP